MRKLMYTLLIVSLLSTLCPAIEVNTVHAAGTNNIFHSEQLDVKEEHATKEKVTYSVTVPKEAAAVDLSTLKVGSGMEIIRTGAEAPKYDPDTRKITFTVKGRVIKAPSKAVIGVRNSAGNLFQANPGNAVCRYSDGKMWQINSRNQTDLKTNLTDYVNTDNKEFPTRFPADIMRKVLTVSDRTLNVNDMYFFEYKQHEKEKDTKGSYFINLKAITEKPIDRSLIDPTSLKVPKSAVKAIDTSSNAIPFFPANYDEKNPTIGVTYNMELDYYNLMEANKIKPYDPKFLTGHAGCWMYQAYYQYYVVAQTKETTAYEYKGNVEFYYTKYETATLVGTLTADPSSVQFKDNDITVDLILEGEVVNIEDPGALDYYLLYVRLEDGTMISDPKGDKIVANGKATVKKTYKYTISKSRLSSTSVKELTQEFAGRVRGFYKASSYYTGELNSGLVKASTYVYKQAPVEPPPPTTGPQKQPPVAVINGMTQVKLGDYTMFDGYSSYDPDGTVEEYRWVMPEAKDVSVVQDKYDMTYADVTAYYDKLGPQKVLLYVKDNDGLQNGTYLSLVVVEPTVEASIIQSGTLKENRKVTFRESSNSPSKYPVIAANTTWTIESLTSGVPASSIKYSGSLKGKKEIDVLFKQPGDYLVTLSVENTAGYKDTVQRMYTITPDEVPIVDFTFQQKVYRDPSNQNLATFELFDQSYSVDGDPIVSRKWYVVYDANNDGIFNEPRVLFNDGNNTEVTYQTNKVGKYAFYLEVQEAFGQPTIEQFVTADDRRKGRTW